MKKILCVTFLIKITFNAFGLYRYSPVRPTQSYCDIYPSLDDRLQRVLDGTWSGKAKFITRIKALVRQGANVNSRSSTNGLTLLIMACRYQFSKGYTRKEMISFLISNGANVNVLDNIHQCPLAYMACQEAHADIVKIVLQYGADPNLQAKVCNPSFTGLTPLHEAGRSDRKGDVVRALLDYGAHITPEFVHDYTPLHIALKCRNKKAAEILLEYGADPLAKDKSGNSFIHAIKRNPHMQD